MSFPRLVGAAAALVLSLAVAAAAAPTAAAAGGPTVLTGHKSGPLPVATGALSTVAALKVGPGAWSISAKASFKATASRLAECLLVSGTMLAVGAVALRASGSGSTGEMFLEGAHRFNDPRKVRLRCTGNGSAPKVKVSDITIVAMKVGKLTNQGTTSGAGGPRVIARHATSPVSIPGLSGLVSVLSMSLPAGDWWVTGAGSAVHGSGGLADYECRLMTPSDFDVQAGHLWNGLDASVFETQVVHHAAAPFIVSIQCSSDVTLDVGFAAITAVRAGRLTNHLIGGGTAGYGSGPPRIASSFADLPAALPGGGALQTVGTAALPAGAWLISATLTVRLISAVDPAQILKITCRLVAAGDVDEDVIRLDVQTNLQETLPLLLTHRSSGAFNANVRCKDDGDPGQIVPSFLKITALKLGTLTHKTI